MNQFFDNITIKAVCSVFCTCISWLMGGYDLALAAVLVLMCADFILGLSFALCAGTYNRNKFLYGCAKFLIYAGVIAISNMVDVTIVEGEFPSVLAKFREFAVFFLAATEFISISNHFKKFGISFVPKRLIERLENFRDGYDPLTGRMDYGHGVGRHNSYPGGYQPIRGQRTPPSSPHVNNNENEEDLYG
ncbi:phage holin family protein [Maridesulfovibrio ferrireducens]|uniref:phage holin family protein n=1 Tax=Maridesulfovibrio ferrireducens TaxID=246191 RepID=UPI001A219459|nr:phage holin family protein [Maridesulfovibrio ferrireducens]MBI9110107.1 phage holin family protein [Maridesulfovibrio ferrireducens]